MTQENKLTTPQIHSASLTKRMLQGAGIGFSLIMVFLLLAGEPDPDWGGLWMVRPLLVVSFAGAVGGVFYYFMDNLRYHGGWRMILANIISLIVFVFGLWMGTVLGLVGTMWH